MRVFKHFSKVELLEEQKKGRVLVGNGKWRVATMEDIEKICLGRYYTYINSEIRLLGYDENGNLY